MMLDPPHEIAILLRLGAVALIGAASGIALSSSAGGAQRGDEAGGDDRVSRLLARARSRVVLPYVAAAALVLIVVALAGHEIEHHLADLESWVSGLGPGGVVVFVCLLALGTSLLLPESLFGVAAGALFGLTWGLVAAVAGNLLAAALQYALSRRLLRGRIRRTLAARAPLAAIQRAVIRDELRLQVLLRLTPLNPATLSYLLGAAGVRFPGFLVACLALAPYLFVEVYLGHAGKNVAGMVRTSRAAALHDAALIAGLVVGIVVIVVLSKTARKAVTQAVAETPDRETPDP